MQTFVCDRGDDGPIILDRQMQCMQTGMTEITERQTADLGCGNNFVRTSSRSLYKHCGRRSHCTGGRSL